MHTHTVIEETSYGKFLDCHKIESFQIQIKFRSTIEINFTILCNKIILVTISTANTDLLRCTVG